MKTCTGPRYDNEFHHLAAFADWHGKYGHLNAIKLDHDSHVTGYGKHNRVRVCIPQGPRVTVSIDRVWELRDPTDAEIIRVLKHYGDAPRRCARQGCASARESRGS